MAVPDAVRPAGEGLHYIPRGNGAWVRPAEGRQIEGNGRQSPVFSYQAVAYLQFKSGGGERLRPSLKL